jgi:Mce-associated membrane protein
VDRTRLLVGGLALTMIASLVALVLVWRDRDDAEDRADSAEALVEASVAAEKVARDAVTRMTTYSYRTIEEDFSWVDEVGTEKFQENFAGASEQAVTYITSVKAKAVGTVIDASATAADADHVKVLLFVDQRIRSEQEAEPGLDQPRITMQMVREDGEWLVDEVQLNNLVSSQGSG